MKKLLFLIAWLSLTIGCKNVLPIGTEPISINKASEGDIDKGRELPPNERFGELFEAVQMNKVFGMVRPLLIVHLRNLQKR